MHRICTFLGSWRSYFCTLLLILWPAFSANNFVTQMMHLPDLVCVSVLYQSQQLHGLCFCSNNVHFQQTAGTLYWPSSSKTLIIELATFTDVCAHDCRSLHCIGAANDISCKLSETLCDFQELTHKSMHMHMASQIAADVPGAYCETLIL